MFFLYEDRSSSTVSVSDSKRPLTSWCYEHGRLAYDSVLQHTGVAAAAENGLDYKTVRRRFCVDPIASLSSTVSLATAEKMRWRNGTWDGIYARFSPDACPHAETG